MKVEETIRAKCLYVTMVSDDRSFVVADFLNEATQKRFKASGRNSIPPYCSPDMLFDAIGNWSTYQKNGVKYEFFDVKKIEPIPYASRESFIGYLTTTYKGIGQKTANKLLNALRGDYASFKEKAYDYEFLKKAVGKKTAASIVEQTKELEEEDELYKTLQAAGISPLRIRAFKEKYGADATSVLTDNPYILYEQYHSSFASCEKLCMTLLQKNPDLITSYERISSCINYVMRNSVAFRGHTYVGTVDLPNMVLRKLNEGKVSGLCVSIKDINRALNEMLSENKIVCGKVSSNFVAYDAFYYNAEKYISERIAEMCSTKYSFDEKLREKYRKAILDAEAEHGITLEEKQREAVMMVLTNKFSVITGSAGTGKTTVLNVCISAYENVSGGNTDIVLTAPTGRAALRMAEATGLRYSASTIHSLLGLTGEEDDTSARTPQQVNCDVLFVDESSMCEIGLFYKLLYNTDQFTKIVLIGDPNQLPPVGAGEVLKSVIESHVVPTTKLSVIYRQLNSSKIVYNATQVMNGNNKLQTGSDFVYYPYPKEEDIKQIVLKTFSEELKRINDIREVQIITPMREKGVISAQSLNAAIQAMVNPIPEFTSTGEKYKPLYIALTNGLRAYKGDKVICQKNTKEVKNGDIGIIKRMYHPEDSKKITVEIEFEGREVMEFTPEQLTEMQLNLGYAITVHKSQGSEFKSVILPVAEENKVMLRRNLFYTAITRAREKFILIGGADKVCYAIQNNAQDFRRTCLASRITAEYDKLNPKPKTPKTPEKPASEQLKFNI